MNTREMLVFLSDLENDNSLEWMRRSKARYLEAKQAFCTMLQELIFRIAEFDPSVARLRAEDLVFRLNRDTRFGKDTSPYNASFRAHVSAAGRQPIPVGYFICVRPSASVIGGGLFASQFPDATAMVRDCIVRNEDRWRSILSDPEFAAVFALQGEKLKKVPQGYDGGHPLAETLKQKSWYIERPVGDGQIIGGDVAGLARQYRLMKPLNDFLNEALRGFAMPKR